MEAMSVNLWTALVTPFTSEGKVDDKAFEKLISYQLDSGVKGLLLFGSTGEAATLTSEEKSQLTEIVNRNKQDAQLMIGITHNNTEVLLENAKQAQDWGADVLLVAPPYYNKPTAEGLIEHFSRLHEETHLPIVLYNIPGRVSVSLPISVIERLAALPRVVGLKEASADMFLGAQAVKLGLTVYSGDDPLTLSYMGLGAGGAISVCANLFPREFQKIVDLASEQKFNQAREEAFKFLELYPVLFSESNPIGIKAAMAHFGLIENVLRLPLVSMSKQNTTHLHCSLEPFVSSHKAH